MKFITLILISSMLILSACEQTEQERAQQVERQMQMQEQLVESTPEFDSSMAEVLNRYFDLKDALVESDASLAAKTAGQLLEEVNGVEPSGLSEESEAVWISFSDVIANSSRELIPLEDVDDQRYHFENLSEAMIEMVDTFQPVGYEIYHQSCPMVRGGSADWLSREQQIANPYHGDRMLRCGEVIRRL